jgi:hypothetical protein
MAHEAKAHEATNAYGPQLGAHAAPPRAGPALLSSIARARAKFAGVSTVLVSPQSMVRRASSKVLEK